MPSYITGGYVGYTEGQIRKKTFEKSHSGILFNEKRSSLSLPKKYQIIQNDITDDMWQLYIKIINNYLNFGNKSSIISGNEKKGDRKIYLWLNLAITDDKPPLNLVVTSSSNRRVLYYQKNDWYNILELAKSYTKCNILDGKLNNKYILALAQRKIDLCFGEYFKLDYSENKKSSRFLEIYQCMNTDAIEDPSDNLLDLYINIIKRYFQLHPKLGEWKDIYNTPEILSFWIKYIVKRRKKIYSLFPERLETLYYDNSNWNAILSIAEKSAKLQSINKKLNNPYIIMLAQSHLDTLFGKIYNIKPKNNTKCNIFKHDNYDTIIDKILYRNLKLNNIENRIKLYHDVHDNIFCKIKEFAQLYMSDTRGGVIPLNIDDKDTINIGQKYLEKYFPGKFFIQECENILESIHNGDLLQIDIDSDLECKEYYINNCDVINYIEKFKSNYHNITDENIKYILNKQLETDHFKIQLWYDIFCKQRNMPKGYKVIMNK